MAISQRTFGVEIECYGENRQGVRNAMRALDLPTHDYYRDSTHPAYCTTWEFKDDGTINATHGHSMELVSPILRGITGLKEVRQVGKILQEHNFDANDSCGLHVHIGVDDLTPKEILKILCRYNDGEELINSFMEENRRNDCGWAQPMDKPRQLLERHHKMWENKGEPEERFVAARWCRGGKNIIGGSGTPLQSVETLCESGGHPHGKSAKVNLYAYHNFKTIEFRQHYGTTDPELITNWIYFLINLIEQSRRLVVSGRDNGPMTGLPTRVRSHFRAQIARFETPCE